jgi:hypothetical protein
MNQSGEPLQAAGVVKRLERPEKVAQPPYSSSRTATDSLPQADPQNRPFDIYEGPALARSRSRTSNVSPWLFVMATALNTMVASVLAVIITLGVVRQERSEVGVRNETVTPNVAFQRISLLPIGSPNQPLRLEPRKPARLSLRIELNRCAVMPVDRSIERSGNPRGN